MRRRRLRLVALSLLASALGACGGGRDGATVGQRPYTAVARFLPGDEVTVIQVTVSDRQALRGAALVGPEGAVIEAESINVSQVADSQQPFFRPPVAGETAAGGVALPFGGFATFAPPGSQTMSSGVIRSTALIRLTDPDSYAKDWRLWQIRLRIGEAPKPNLVMLPAPQPPTGL